MTESRPGHDEPGHEVSGYVLRPVTAPVTPRCRGGWHVLETPRLRMQTQRAGDEELIRAAASDALAQRWLGWRADELMPERDAERILARPPGEGRPVLLPDECWLIAVERASGRFAGAVSVHRGTCEIGGHLAPRFRGCGLGSELFAGTARFAHQHLGMPVITAGTARGNVACVAALISAGFVSAPGAASHTLPDGRVIAARWFSHASAHPAQCAGGG